jgi:CheY-like chemotaxis protein
MAEVLLVDPEHDHRLDVRKSLYLAGCQVLEASSLAEAEAIAGSEHLDLIVTDLFLPGPQGLMFIRQMRREYPDVPVIAMSDQWGDLDTDYQRLALDCGSAATLSKPVVQIDLISLVHDLLDGV